MSQALDGKRVLLVDDDSDILTSMLAAFEPTGAIVDTAANGNKAVELAEKNLPDLVILDMMLPAAADSWCWSGSRPRNRGIPNRM